VNIYTTFNPISSFDVHIQFHSPDSIEEAIVHKPVQKQPSPDVTGHVKASLPAGPWKPLTPLPPALDREVSVISGESEASDDHSQFCTPTPTRINLTVNVDNDTTTLLPESLEQGASRDSSEASESTASLTSSPLISTSSRVSLWAKFKLFCKEKQVEKIMKKITIISTELNLAVTSQSGVGNVTQQFRNPKLVQEIATLRVLGDSLGDPIQTAIKTSLSLYDNIEKFLSLCDQETGQITVIDNIKNMHTNFSPDIAQGIAEWDLTGDAFQKVRQQLGNPNLIQTIVNLKDVGNALGGAIQDSIQGGLDCFRKMSKAMVFIDVATRNGHPYLNTTQLQMVQSILNGEADPLNQAEFTGAPLGAGTYGTVYDTIPGPDGSGDHYAIKCTNRPKDKFADEYTFLRLFNHPHIVQPLYAEDRVLYMELAAGGTLWKPEKPLTDETLWYALFQTADALAYMHGGGYVHGDLKLDNVFLTKDQQAKVGDLGISSHVEEFNDIAINAYRCQHFPPEYLQGQIPQLRIEAGISKYDPRALYAIDSWSFGVMIWEMLKHDRERSVYGNARGDDKYKCKAFVEGYQVPKLHGRLDAEKCQRLDPYNVLRSIMTRCLCANPFYRPTMSQIKDMLQG
jgi:hypothetical protein